ncbi:hypothetical protein V6N13_020274 [Hibiscus sabdariffa]
MSHFQELPDESTALIHSCGGLEIREPLLADANVGASSWNLNDPISRASVEIYISSDSANVEEIENVKVDGALCEMVSRDNNNISWVEGVDRAMNVKNVVLVVEVLRLVVAWSYRWVIGNSCALLIYGLLFPIGLVVRRLILMVGMVCIGL